MPEPSRSEQIVYLTEWAAKNKAALSLNGSVGFGRDCVGIIVGGTYIDTAEAKEATAYNFSAPPHSWWEPEDAYHKHDCLAVLGHGDGPLRQLYDWVKWLEENGWGVEEVYRQPTNDVDLALHGVSLPKLIKADGDPGAS
jgi:hypothetical protein